MKSWQQKVSSIFSSESGKKPDLSPEDKHLMEKKQEHFPFDFDRWYHALHSFSFPSAILAISPDTARAMVNYYHFRFNHRGLLTPDDVAALRKMEYDIQVMMKGMMSAGNCNGVFVRMSNRSPKDGTPLFADGHSVCSIYKTIMDDKSIVSLNDKMIQICEAQMKFLFCPDSAHVMNLLLSSERVFLDLNLALRCQLANPKDQWSTSVILREWQPDLRQEMEFRVFVHNNRVTAISQYNPYCVYPVLISLMNNVDKLNALSNDIIQFVAKVGPLIRHADYIIDLAVIGDQIKIVELNPFAPSTGASLFSWKNDQNIIFGNANSPTIRVKTNPVNELDKVIEGMIVNEEVLAKENIEPYFKLLDSVSLQSKPASKGP